MGVEPVPGEPAALADLDGERALVVADYHAGIEAGLRAEGVELRSGADGRRASLLDALDSTGADRLVVLGDLANAIGRPRSEERAEIRELLSAALERGPVTVVRGNHDGDLESVIDGAAFDAVEVTPATGRRLGPVGFAHGHTWPAREVVTAETVCTAHEHPVVRLEDEVGGTRKERVWLRGRLDPAPFVANDDDLDPADVAGELVVFPAFNDLSGGTWINVEGQSFLSPFLPEGVADAEAYLLDGTRLGDYRRV